MQELKLLSPTSDDGFPGMPTETSTLYWEDVNLDIPAYNFAEIFSLSQTWIGHDDRISFRYQIEPVNPPEALGLAYPFRLEIVLGLTESKNPIQKVFVLHFHDIRTVTYQAMEDDGTFGAESPLQTLETVEQQSFLAPSDMTNAVIVVGIFHGDNDNPAYASAMDISQVITQR